MTVNRLFEDLYLHVRLAFLNDSVLLVFNLFIEQLLEISTLLNMFRVQLLEQYRLLLYRLFHVLLDTIRLFLANCLPLVKQSLVTDDTVFSHRVLLCSNTCACPPVGSLYITLREQFFLPLFITLMGGDLKIEFGLELLQLFL